MQEFDPDHPANVHDALNDRIFVWHPAWADSWRENAFVASDGLAYWDGLIIDGWNPIAALAGGEPSGPRPGPFWVMRPADRLRRAREKRDLAVRLRQLARDLSDEASINLLSRHADNLEAEADLLERTEASDERKPR